MSQRTLAKYLQIVTIALAVLAAVIYVEGIPGLIEVLLQRDAIVHQRGITPWILMISVTAIPVYIALYHFWRLTMEIKRDNSFSNENARHLTRISQLCLLDVAYFFAGNLIFFLIDYNGIILLVCSLVVDFIGICVAVLAAVLSHLVYKAAAMREENELTI